MRDIMPVQGAAQYDEKNHAAGVSFLSRRIAEQMRLSFRETEAIGQAGYCHDIGKEHIPLSLLNKPGKLTRDEFARMKEHIFLGFEALKGLAFQRFSALAALEHHERMDGSGYMGRAGNEISLAGRIVAVADVYDSLRTARPYRPAWDYGRVIRHMESERGRRLDGAAVDALFRCLEREPVLRNHSCLGGSAYIEG